jgi:hypothetical protein
MRKSLVRLALVGATVAALMPVSPSAHAFVCNDKFPTEELGPTFCFVVYTVTAPICKFGCG